MIQNNQPTTLVVTEATFVKKNLEKPRQLSKRKLLWNHQLTLEKPWPRVAISYEITQNHTASLFHMNYSKSHHVNITHDITQNHTALLSIKIHVRSKINHVLKHNCIATSLLKVAKFKTKYLISCHEYKNLTATIFLKFYLVWKGVFENFKLKFVSLPNLSPLDLKMLQLVTPPSGLLSNWLGSVCCQLITWKAAGNPYTKTKIVCKE